MRRLTIYLMLSWQLTSSQNPLPTSVQLTPPVDAPAIVQNKFQTDHPNVSATWRVEDEEHYRAEYTDADLRTRQAVVYDASASLIRHEQEISSAHYPKAIRSYYASYAPKEDYVVWQSEDPRGKRLYYTIDGTGKKWFDRNGKVINK